MKTRRILIALTVVLLTSFNQFAGAVQEKGTLVPVTGKHRIDIRVNQDKQVVIRAACLDNQKRVNLVLKVYNQNGEVVYASSFYKKGGLYKGFDLSQLPAGKYTFEVHKNLTRIYSKEILKSAAHNPADLSASNFTIKEL